MKKKLSNSNSNSKKKMKKRKNLGSLVKVAIMDREQPVAYAQTTYAINCTIYTFSGC